MQDDIYGERRRTYIKALTKKYRARKRLLITIVVIAVSLTIAIQVAGAINTANDKVIQWGVEILETPTYKATIVHAAEEEPKPEQKTIYAKVTGYNTVPEQTDSTPCIAQSGKNICGRKDVAACPRSIETGTIIKIDGKKYTCLDTLAPKYDNRFDISCDKDMKCPYEIGNKVREVTIYK